MTWSGGELNVLPCFSFPALIEECQPSPAAYLLMANSSKNMGCTIRDDFLEPTSLRSHQVIDWHIPIW